MKLQKILGDQSLVSLLNHCEYGIEKECIRVEKGTGKLALTPHPSSLSDKNNHPYIQTDYSESQPEIITPPLSPMSQTLDFLKALNDVLYRALPEDELLWINSIPGHLPENENDIPISKTDDQETYQYRVYTGEKYGRSRQLMSGLHINFSFPKLLLEKIFQSQDDIETMRDFQDYIYMKVSRNFIRTSWILIYFYGATPIAKDSYFTKSLERGEAIPSRPMRSIRNSTYGYFNNTEVTVRYDNIHNYIYDIQESVRTKLLAEEREYYSGVRLRTPMGKHLADLVENGIRYLEFRSLDLNPYSPTGLTYEQGMFLHLYFIYLFWKEEEIIEAPRMGLSMSIQTAEEEPLSLSRFKDVGHEILNGMEDMLDHFAWNEYADLLNLHREALENPELTIAGKMMTEISNVDDFIDFCLEKAEGYRKEAVGQDFKFMDFQGEDLEDFQAGLVEGRNWDKLKVYLESDI